jgi:omega-amidase
MQNLRIALIQSNLCWEDPAANLQHLDSVISAMNREVDLILLPEMFPTAFSMRCEIFADDPEGEVLDWIRRKAAATGASIAGSAMIKDNGLFYNRLYLVKPDGRYDFYDKRHLFRMGEENLHYTPGNRRVIANIGGWKVLLLICYDLRFPVWIMNNYMDGVYDYDAILIVANWPAARAGVWKTLLQARAIDNQCFVAGVNRIGLDGSGNAHQGDSMIISPRGELLAHCAENAECTEYAEISKDMLDNFRQKFRVAYDWDDFTLNY